MSETPQSTKYWRRYEKSNDYIDLKNLINRSNQCWNFYIGKQWEGVEADGEELPFLNFIHPNILRKVTTIYTNRMAAIYIEDTANGTAIIETLKHEILGIIAVAPDKSKEARVNAVSFAIEAGNVYLPENDPITFKFIEQCAKFPNDKHDDMVDSASMALAKLVYTRSGRVFSRLKQKVSGWTLPSERPPKRVDVGGMIHTL